MQDWKARGIRGQKDIKWENESVTGKCKRKTHK